MLKDSRLQGCQTAKAWTHCLVCNAERGSRSPNCVQDVNEEFKGPSGKAASASAGTCKAVNQAVLEFVQAISSDSLGECKLHQAAGFPEGGAPLRAFHGALLI